MFNTNIEIDSKYSINLRANINEMSSTLEILEKAENSSLSCITTLVVDTIEEYNKLEDFDLSIFNYKHVNFEISNEHIWNLDLSIIIKNLLIKDITRIDRNSVIKTYKPSHITSFLEQNNKKILSKFNDIEIKDWNPVYNAMNETLLLSQNLTDALNNSLLEKKEIKAEVDKAKKILEDL